MSIQGISSDLKAGGRKYAVVVRTLELGFLLGLIGLLVAVMKPDIAQYVAAIVGTFGLLGSASIVSYQGANAAADWHGGAKPAPRQSGMVQVGDG